MTDSLSPLMDNILNSTSQQQTPSSSSSSDDAHLKTYTVGEDQGRLAEMAKEFGLARHREPKRQVRAPANLHHRRHSSEILQQRMMAVIFDHGLEDARMQAIYTSHRDSAAHEMFAKYDDEVLQEEGYEEVEVDPHAHGIGGDLTSAVLGIIKSMVGPAILYLPHGFASAGYAIALPTLFVATCLYLYSTTCLIDSWRIESKEFDDDDSNVANENAIPEEEEYNEYQPLINQNNSTSSSSINSSNYGGTSGDIELTGNDEQLPPTHRPAARRQQKRRALLSYPELAYRSLGPTGESMVKTGIALMQSGVCLTYLIFVPHNLHSSMSYLFGLKYLTPSHWLLAMIVIQIPLSWIRDIRKFTITNLLANCCILYGLMICLTFAFKEASTTPIYIDTTDDNYGVNVETGGNSSNTTTTIDKPLQAMWYRFSHLPPYMPSWFIFIGTSILLFEGTITLMVPLQEAVVGHERRKKFPSVFRCVIISIVSFYAVFAMVCWTGFGNSVRTVLTVSLPPGILSSSVQVAYSIAVIFTFPLQNFPSLEISCHSVSSIVMKSIIGTSTGDPNSNNSNNPSTNGQLEHPLPSSSFSSITEKPWYIHRNFLSSVIVCLLSVIAVISMDSLDKVVSLMGSLLGCPIAFIFPPLIHNKINEKKISPIRRTLNYVVSFFGVFCMIIASIITIIQW